ncbi:MAG: FAD-dependent oxidoreductase [Propionibacteriales bacterium]|nr:FAD-dependent oxidoreductase [Propionibacteriales bacterium]
MSEVIHTDVAVVGAGNAALCAAITAAQAGARVLVLEKAPYAERGGNSRFTGGLLRFAFPSKEDVLGILEDLSGFTPEQLDAGPYPAEQYVADVSRLSGGRCDGALIEMLAAGSNDAVRWLAKHGVTYELYEKYVEHAGRINWPDRAMVKVRGGGEGLVAALFAAAERHGVDIRYDAQVVGVEAPGERVQLAVRFNGTPSAVDAAAAVLGSGGFEANPAARASYLGPSWDLAKARGTRHNTGEILAQLLAMGAAPVGHWSGAHAVPVDAGSADVGDLRVGALTTRLSYPYGIMVNVDGHRFVDEGSDFKLLTYAKIGREVLRQPEGRAYQIFDQRTVGLIEPRYELGSTSVVANTIEALAGGIGVDRAALTSTIAEYNASVRDGEFNAAVLDGKGTDGLVPAKSNWAQRIDQPPYVAYPVTCGITFTYGGVGVDAHARVLSSAGHPMPGLYATGEITGGFFYHNYPAGAGLIRGTVFGRIAGEEAARRALALTAGAPA